MCDVCGKDDHQTPTPMDALIASIGFDAVESCGITPHPVFKAPMQAMVISMAAIARHNPELFDKLYDYIVSDDSENGEKEMVELADYILQDWRWLQANWESAKGKAAEYFQQQRRERNARNN